MKSESIHKFKRILGRGFIESIYKSLRFLSDEKYLRLMFRLRMGTKLDLENPKTISEKLQWLKLYDRKDIYTAMADKYLAKKFIAEKVGEEYVIPLIGVWDKFDEIDFGSLPNKFVLKCNHDSGSVIICEDKAKLDVHEARRILEKSLRTDYFILKREWQYKNIQRKIICEQYLSDEGKDGVLTDYKFFCFSGIPKFLYVATDSSNQNEHETFLDLSWNTVPFRRKEYPEHTNIPQKPVNFDEMVKIARQLSADISFLRVDFYEVRGKLYVGELTLFPGAGYLVFDPDEYNRIIGDWVDLPR